MRPGGFGYGITNTFSMRSTFSIARAAAAGLCAAFLLCAPAIEAAPTEMQSLAATLHDSEFSARVERLLKQNRPAQAVELAEIGINRNPRNAQLQFMRSIGLERLGRTEEAAKSLRSLIAAYPEIPEPYKNLAVIEAGFGNLEDAVRLLNQALAINPDFATARKNLGDVFLALAIENYEKAAPVLSGNDALQTRLKTLQRLVDRK